ncbi:MAG: hypothetical protein ACKO90_43705, partial [Microcystis panniformis]
MMLATETRVQVSILGYLFSDLKEAVGGRRSAGFRSQDSGDYFYLFSPHPTSPLPTTPHPTP